MTTDDAMQSPSIARLSRRHFVLRLGAAAGSLGFISLLDAACAPAAPAPPSATSAPAAAPKPTAAPAAASPAVVSASPAASPAAKPAASPAASQAAIAAPSPSAAPAAAAALPGLPGGTLRTTLGAEPTTLDPHKRTSLFDADVHCALFVGLVSNVITDTSTGALAESWTSPDAKSWTFKLRNGLTFHDGQPVTPETVKFSMDRLIAPETGTSGGSRRAPGRLHPPLSSTRRRCASISRRPTRRSQWMLPI